MGPCLRIKDPLPSWLHQGATMGACLPAAFTVKFWMAGRSTTPEARGNADVCCASCGGELWHVLSVRDRKSVV